VSAPPGHRPSPERIGRPVAGSSAGESIAASEARVGPGPSPPAVPSPRHDSAQHARLLSSGASALLPPAPPPPPTFPDPPSPTQLSPRQKLIYRGR
jgi:hypothetical protein